MTRLQEMVSRAMDEARRTLLDKIVDPAYANRQEITAEGKVIARIKGAPVVVIEIKAKFDTLGDS